MKKTFETPEITVLYTQSEDIITTSLVLEALDSDQLSHWHRLR